VQGLDLAGELFEELLAGFGGFDGRDAPVVRDGSRVT